MHFLTITCNGQVQRMSETNKFLFLISLSLYLFVCGLDCDMIMGMDNLQCGRLVKYLLGPRRITKGVLVPRWVHIHVKITSMLLKHCGCKENQVKSGNEAAP